MLGTEDILLIDKPKGISSFAVIYRLRKKLGVKKIGHAGTLDPLASGLLLVGVGEGTKKLKDLVGLPKEYVADILVGERRSTGDMEGEVLESKDVTCVDTKEVESVLASMKGTLRLLVSAYSAMKMGGVPFYKRARAAERTGKPLTVTPVRDMEIISASCEKVSCGDGRCIVTVKFNVGSGTYIRSLAEEFGRRLGYPATLKNLRRTKVGEFRVEDATTVDSLSE